MEKKKVALLKNFWGIGQFGNSIYTYLETAFFTIFLTDVAKFPIALVGGILTFTATADFIIAPLMGSVINLMKPLKWGRNRSWLLLGPIILLPFAVLQYTVFGNGIVAAALLSAVYIIGHILLNLSYTADVAIIPCIAADEKMRLKLNSNRMVGSNLGRLANSYVVPTVIAALTSMSFSEEKIYVILASGFSLVLMFGYLCEFFMTKGMESSNKNAESLENADRLNFKDMLEAFKGNTNLPAIVVADLGSNIGSFLIPTLNVYYYKYVAINIPNVGLANHLLITGLCGLCGAKLAGMFRKAVKNKKNYLLSVYLLVSLSCVLSRIFAFNGYIFVIFQGIMQLLIGTSQPFELDLYMETAAYHEQETGKNVTPFIMGLTNVPAKLSVIIRGVVISLTLSLAGYVPGAEITPMLQSGLANGYLIVPGIVPLISFIALLFFYKIKPKASETL